MGCPRSQQLVIGTLCCIGLQCADGSQSAPPAAFATTAPAGTWPADGTLGAAGERAPTPRLKIVTGGDAGAVAAAREVTSNHRDYARRHAYAYEVHAGNYAHPWTVYWHKIGVLLHELQRPGGGDEPMPGVVVWMDLDVLVTNPLQRMLERVLEAHPGKALILTEDPLRGDALPTFEGRAKRLTNTGIILARRGEEAVRVLRRLIDYGRLNTAAAFSPQSKNTLHEQDAFNWLLGGPLGRLLSQQVAVIPQREGAVNLNTFSRNLYDDRYQDPELAEWREGDFTAHCSGLRNQHRRWCIDDSLAAADSVLDAVDLANR